MENSSHENISSYENKRGREITEHEKEALTIDAWERKIILESIERNFHNLSRVCRELKIGRTTLWRKMKKYNIQ